MEVLAGFALPAILDAIRRSKKCETPHAATLPQAAFGRQAGVLHGGIDALRPLPVDPEVECANQAAQLGLVKSDSNTHRAEDPHSHERADANAYRATRHCHQQDCGLQARPAECTLPTVLDFPRADRR